MTKHFYLMPRGFGIGCQPKPKEGTFVTVENGHPLQLAFKDVISYEYPLTEDEKNSFELREIEEQKDGTWQQKS